MRETTSIIQHGKPIPFDMGGQRIIAQMLAAFGHEHRSRKVAMFSEGPLIFLQDRNILRRW